MTVLDDFNSSRWQEAAVIFQRMKNLVENSDELLQHYQDDFYVHDKNYLFTYHTPNQEYLWSVRDTGSYIAALNINENITEFVKATAQGSNAGGRSDRFYHITKDGLKEVSPVRALNILEDSASAYQLSTGKESWSIKDSKWVRDGQILRKGQPILNVEFKRDSDNAKLDINLTSFDGSLVNAADKTATTLMLVNGGLASTYSMFAQIKSMTLDGEDLIDSLNMSGYEDFIRDEEVDSLTPQTPRVGM